jgi:hypothetical protein
VSDGPDPDAPGFVVPPLPGFGIAAGIGGVLLLLTGAAMVMAWQRGELEDAFDGPADTDRPSVDAEGPPRP